MDECKPLTPGVGQRTVGRLGDRLGCPSHQRGGRDREDEAFRSFGVDQRQGLILFTISAQLELFLSPTKHNLTHECVPRVLKLSSNVNECTPLTDGDGGSLVHAVDLSPKAVAVARHNAHRNDEVTGGGGRGVRVHEGSWQGLTLVHFSAQPEPMLVTEAISSAHLSAQPETCFVLEGTNTSNKKSPPEAGKWTGVAHK